MSDLDRRAGESLQEHLTRLAGMDTGGLSVWAMRHRADLLARAEAALAKAAREQAAPDLPSLVECTPPRPLLAHAQTLSRLAAPASLARAQDDWRRLSETERRDFLAWVAAEQGKG
jgi:hypothetical protein